MYDKATELMLYKGVLEWQGLRPISITQISFYKKESLEHKWEKLFET